MLSAKTNGVISSSTDSMEPLAQRVVFILLKNAAMGRFLSPWLLQYQRCSGRKALLCKGGYVRLRRLHENAGIAGVANELHAQIPPLFAAFHGVGKAADFHALGIGFGNDLP